MGGARKLPKNHDQGIVFNGSVRKRIVAVFIVSQNIPTERRVSS